MDTPTVELLKMLAEIKTLTRVIQQADPNGAGLVLKAVQDEIGSRYVEKAEAFH